jgi:predicted metal-dependent enzyme (double-stranded beta helix superfamily)
MFDHDRFIVECSEAVAADPSHKAVREVVARAVRAPSDVLRGLGAPTRSGVEVLYRSPKLTVLNVIWAPRMSVFPHNHNMWAVIGVYSGREDNIFWRRTSALDERQIEAAGARSLCPGDTEPLGADIVHSVLNPIDRLTAAIHVYGGDFVAMERSEWDAETLREQPYDFESTRRTFEAANESLVRALR